jgi:predicted 2-oxoglutarate/Fe(II)-dependent dioxygenase YbiX
VHSVIPVTKGKQTAVVIWACKNAASQVGISNERPKEITLKMNLVKRLYAIHEWEKTMGK